MKNALLTSGLIALGLMGLFNLGVKKAAGVLFLSRTTGRVGLSKRASHMEYHPGKWSATGGLLDKRESYREAASREVFEEIGVRINKKDLKEIHTIKLRRVRTSEIINYKLYVYMIDDEFIPKNIDRNEISDFSWKYPEEWGNIHPGLEVAFKHIDYLSFNADDDTTDLKKLVDWDEDDYEDIDELEDYVEKGEYLIKYNEGELKLNWRGGHWMDFNDAWTDKLWKQINPKIKKIRSFKTYSADSSDLGNCSKCGKPLSPWDIDDHVSIIPLRDNKDRGIICKTCGPYFMAEGHSKNLKVGLVQGRHDLPVDNFVFDEIIRENGFAELIVNKLVKDAKKWIEQNCYVGHGRTVELYVTGFTPALTAFIIAWNYMDVDCELIFKHYDNETGEYVSQKYRRN